MALSTHLVNMTDTGSNVFNPNSAYIAEQILKGNLPASYYSYPGLVEYKNGSDPFSRNLPGDFSDPSAFNYGDPDSYAATLGTDIPFYSGQVLNSNVNDFVDSVKGKVVDSVKSASSSFDKVLDSLNSKVLDSLNSVSNSFSSGFGSLGDALRDSALISANSQEEIQRLINDTAAANNAWSAEQAQINRDWQERMSNTAHQREVEDLKASGLNPVLSAGGGSGASTGSGAVGQVDNSNTRLLAEVALQSLENAEITAAALSRVSSFNTADSFLGRVLNNSYSKKALGSLSNALGNGLGRFVVKSVLGV